VKATVVHSLGQLVDRATPDQPDAASGRLRETSVYRGVSEKTDHLLTSLDRLSSIDQPHLKGHLEEHLLRNFIRYGHPMLKDAGEDLWQVMVTAAQHGLPTRLLDWTQSPLIAAHFATMNPEPESDRIIWKLNWKRVHQQFGLPDVAFLVQDLGRVLKERGFEASWAFLNANEEKGKAFVCLLEPPAFTPRLEVQSGAFTLASSKTKSLETILAEAGVADALEQFVIPAPRVNFIRDQLDICAVDERHLFPDLDGIAAGLRRYYSSSS
jgi:hypothetical protein